MDWFFGYYWDYDNSCFRCPHCKHAQGMSNEDLLEKGAQCGACGYISYIWDSDSRKVQEERRRQEQERLAAEQQRQQAERDRAQQAAAAEKSRREREEKARLQKEEKQKQHEDRVQKRERRRKRQDEDLREQANNMLVLLLRPGQEKKPDAEVLELEKRIPDFIEKRFLIPDDVISYPRPLRDKYIPFEDRNTWPSDRYPQLIITAYMLGATIERLPEPHQYRYHFYKMVALEQQIAIYETIIHRCNLHPVPIPPSTAELEQQDDYEEWKWSLDNATRRLQQCRAALVTQAQLSERELQQRRECEKERQHRRERAHDQAELNRQLAKLLAACKARGMSHEEIAEHVAELKREFYKSKGATL